MEPRRLTARYLRTNGAFVVHGTAEIARMRSALQGDRLRGVRAKVSRVLEMIGAYENWPTALANRLGATRRGRVVTYRLRRGAAMTVTSGVHDVRVLNEVLIEKVYELRPDFAPRDGWQIVDAGAHKGSFAVLAARGRPEARVVACEPAPANYACLCHNARQNGCANVIAHPVAISGHHGTARLSFDSAASGQGGLSTTGDLEVETRTLPEILGELDGTIDLLKLDIEGAEFEALRAADSAALSRVQRIVLEYHAAAGMSQANAGRELARLLEQRGYAVELMDNRPFLWAWRQDRRG
jgi:FkbM family methyltransferase